MSDMVGTQIVGFHTHRLIYKPHFEMVDYSWSSQVEQQWWCLGLCPTQNIASYGKRELGLKSHSKDSINLKPMVNKANG